MAKITNPRDAVLALALAQYMKKDIAAHVAEVETEAKQVLLDTLTPENKSQGYAGNDGTLLAETLLVCPKQKETYIVADEQRFARWLKKNGYPKAHWVKRLAPTETQPERIAQLIEKTGELPDGVSILTGQRPPYLKTTIKDKEEFTRQIEIAALLQQVTETALIGHTADSEETAA